MIRLRETQAGDTWKPPKRLSREGGRRGEEKGEALITFMGLHRLSCSGSHLLVSALFCLDVLAYVCVFVSFVVLRCASLIRVPSPPLRFVLVPRLLVLLSALLGL